MKTQAGEPERVDAVRLVVTRPIDEKDIAPIGIRGAVEKRLKVQLASQQGGHHRFDVIRAEVQQR